MLIALLPWPAAAVSILAAPQNQTALPGENVKFTITVDGHSPISYQWRLNGNPLLGETNDILVLSNVQATNGGAFSVTVVDADDAVTTEPGVLQVTAATGPALTDAFTNRPTVLSYTGILQGNSFEAHSEPGEPLLSGGGRTVWCRWVAPDSGIVTLSTRGSAFDTLLGVFTGNDLSNLTPVTHDDDLGGFYTSALSFNAQRGVAYEFLLDGYDYAGTGGEYTLSWNLEATRDTAPLLLIRPQATSVLAGSNALFHVVTGSTDDALQWYFNGAPITGATSPTLLIAHAARTNVGFYHVRATKTSGRFVESPPVDLQIASGDGALVQNNFLVLMQDKYQQSYLPSMNDTNVAPPSSGLISIGLGNSYSKDAYSSVNGQAGDPTPCASGLYGTTWQAVLATNSGIMQVDTIDSLIPARLAVYRGAPGLPGTVLVACDVTSCLSNNPAVVKFNATAGTNYTLVFEAYQTNDVLSFNCRLGAAPAANNSKLACLVAAGGSFVLDAPPNNWSPPPTFFWRFNNALIPNANSPSLLLTNFGPANAGSYQVVLSNFVMTATSQVNVLSLAGPFLLGRSWVTNAGKVSFRIAASNAAPFILQWSANVDSGWQSVATNLDPCHPLLFTNANAPPTPARFFRAIPWPPPP